MVAKIEFFPVGNGDMTLLSLESGKKILIDCNIRVATDNKGDAFPDVAAYLRDRLDRDSEGRLAIDAFLLSHPDKDHCLGLKTHFHLGEPGSWSKDDDKIFIREMWSSPIVFRRRDRIDTLCDDAEAWRDEARRRANLHKSNKAVEDGDRLLVLGEDLDDKTKGLEDILINVGEVFDRICDEVDESFSAVLVGPIMPSDDEDDEELLAKNRSSTIVQFHIGADGEPGACRLLTGGDAEVAIWERLWAEHSGNVSHLEYDVLQVPHHCSWHVLSYDSWSKKGEDAKVAEDALNALSQASEGAILVSSSKAVSEDDSDPPCIRAKREYDQIAEDASGEFVCVAEYVDDNEVETLAIEISGQGATLNNDTGSNTPSSFGSPAIKKTNLPPKGGDRWAWE